MSEKNERKTGIVFFGPQGHKMDVFNRGPVASFIEIAEIFRGVDAPSVAAMVVDDAGKTPADEISYQRIIPFLMLAHAVDELDDCLW